MSIMRNLYRPNLAFFLITFFSIISLQSCEEETVTEPSSSRAVVPFRPITTVESSLLISPSTVRATQAAVARICRATGSFYLREGFLEIGLFYIMAAGFVCLDPEALCSLGKFYEHGFPTTRIVIPPGLLRSLRHYGLLTFQGTENPWFTKSFAPRRNTSIAKRIYRQLIKQGFEAARPLLGKLYLRVAIQKRLDGDYLSAFKLFRLAMKEDNADAAYLLGSMYENREIVAGDSRSAASITRGLSMAIHFYTAAGQLGYPQAEAALSCVRRRLDSHKQIARFCSSFFSGGRPSLPSAHSNSDDDSTQEDCPPSGATPPRPTVDQPYDDKVESQS